MANDATTPRPCGRTEDQAQKAVGDSTAVTPPRHYLPRVFRLDPVALNLIPTLTADDPRHGTVNGYVNFKCRCPDCKTAGQEYRAARRAKRTEVAA